MTETAPQFAILLDGSFVIKKLYPQLQRFPNADDIEQACARIRAHDLLRDLSLLRIYFYNAPPATGTTVNPIDGQSVNLSLHPTVGANNSLHDTLELKPDFALRLGECMPQGWEVKPTVLQQIRRQKQPAQPRQLGANDVRPKISQKGVDLRIGLDLARLALCHLVRTVVVVTGDSDFVPALKFARREGLRVLLDTMGHSVRRELKVHADQLIDVAMPPKPQRPTPKKVVAAAPAKP